MRYGVDALRGAFSASKMGAGLDFRGCVRAIEAKRRGTKCMMDATAAVAFYNVWQFSLPYYDPESSIITFCVAFYSNFEDHRLWKGVLSVVE